MGNIQNDKNKRILEIMFGIPNYRYKVCMIKFGITILLLFALLYMMGWVADFTIINIPVCGVVIQVMVPLIFFSCLGLLLATLVKNGNGAAVIKVIVGLIFWFLSGSLSSSKWDLFLNPFITPSDLNTTIWIKTITQNRIILTIGAVISILWAQINMQKREKFV